MVFIECGILKGSGLAIWADLFPMHAGARIIGLDIDLSHYKLNFNNLMRIGAFKSGAPEVYEYDTYLDDSERLATILRGDKINVFIDDASHTDESILMNIKNVRKFLANDFVYIIEDNRTARQALKADPCADWYMSVPKKCQDLTVISSQLLSF